jgi:prephenate dehydratase
LARENPRAAAVIASSLSAELYNLEIIKERIEDGPSNSTRFLLISRAPYENAGNKTSIIFVTPHKAGSLYGALRLFADSGINLTRIASMPLRTEPSNYSFFLDFEGSETDEAVSDVLHKLEKLTLSLKFLGSYPADHGAS